MTNSTHFIDGQWIDGLGHNINSIDPTKNVVIWEAKSASETQVDQAIVAARRAFPAWSLKTVEERLVIIKRFAALLGENKA